MNLPTLDFLSQPPRVVAVGTRAAGGRRQSGNGTPGIRDSEEGEDGGGENGGEMRRKAGQRKAPVKWMELTASDTDPEPRAHL
jgi:hypothetical protein